MKKIDLMSDTLSVEEYQHKREEAAIEYEMETGFKFWLLIRAMLLGARGKPKQTILIFRIDDFLKKQAKEFRPELAKAKEEMLAELE